MEPELLDRILKKATGECNVIAVHLYNWTEPFLHPRLSEMIEIVNSYDIGCGLSTNLNILPKIDDIMATNPEYITISTSGFTQSVYGRTHRGGDIERVKKNMAALAESRTRAKSDTRIEVKYLVYFGNVDESAQMKTFAESLGFIFRLNYAILMPLEKLLAFVSNGSSGEDLSDEDRQMVEMLIFPHKEVINLTKPYRKLPCILLEDWVMINSQGKVQLCCMVYNEDQYTIANYLSNPLLVIQDLKREHWQCPDCHEYGIAAARNWPVLDMNKLILEKFVRYYSDLGFDMHSLLTKARRRGKVNSWIMNNYRVTRVKVARIPWLRRQYSKIRKIWLEVD